MQINKSFWNYTFAILITGAITACGNDSHNGDEHNADTTKTEEPVVENNDDSEIELSFVMPSPLQIASIFKRSGLEYIDGITNPISNASNYSSNLSKSLNFGVYAADLSYVVLNNQSQQSLDYMKTVKQLSDELGMGSIMSSEGLFKSFETNIGNEDSIVNILATVQEGMDEYLEENNRQYQAAVFFAGAWAEGMYIGAKAATSSNDKVAIRLVEQMTILQSLIKGLQQHPNPPEGMADIIGGLNAVLDIFNGFEFHNNIDEDEEYSYEDISISDEELEGLKGSIEQLRTIIVES